MKTYYESKNIKYNTKTKLLYIDANKSMFAISNGNLRLWKYLENDESDNKSLDKLIPTRVLKQLNE